MSKSLLRERQPWTYYAKWALMALVAAAGVLRAANVPEWAKITADVVIAVGTVFGIASAGLTRR